MADAHPNSDCPAIDQPGMAKKKKAKAPRKPRVECLPEEIAKLDAESAKRRNWRAIMKDNAAACKFGAERDAMEAARRKIEVEEKEAIVNKAHALLMLGICRPNGFSTAVVGPASTGSSVARSSHCQSPTSRTTAVSPGFPPPRHDAHIRFLGSPDVSVIAPSTPRPSACIDLNITHVFDSGGRSAVEMQRKQARPPFAGTMSSPRVMFDEMATLMPPVDDTYCAQFMEDVIYNGGHVPAYDPDETQSQDGRAQFVADEEADDRADYDHGDSWHGDDDIYCEGDGDEDEVNDIDISGEPLFIDELTQRAEAQKKKKSIRTGPYTQDEDKLICNSWMEIS
ncbi:Formin-like protein 15 [Hordeum vulgare]|nr:Formin-like protein 15 [Hordeum vulgare]